MTRYRAAGIHFTLSVVVTAVLVTLMLKVWYPDGYFKLMGGGTLFFLILGVDLCLGPLLTLIVFNPTKKTLKFDLLIIGLIQTLAMCYGVYVMLEARPVFTVFNKTGFQVVSAVDIDPRELVLGKKDEWRTLSITGPKLVAIGIPDKKNKKEAIFALVVSEEASRYPRLYDDYSHHRDEVLKTGRPLQELINTGKRNKFLVNQLVYKNNRPIDDFLFLPITSPVENMVSIIDAKNGEFISLLDIKY